MATDTELNSYVSLRKFAPYRVDEDKKGKSKKRLKELRDSLKNREWGIEPGEEKEGGYKKTKWSEVNGRKKEGEEGEEKTGAKRVGKKERERRKKAAAEAGEEAEAMEEE